MTVAIDTSVLLLLLDPAAAPAADPSTGNPTTRPKERLEYLITQISEAGTRVMVPTPVLAEVLAKAGQAAPQYLKVISGAAKFRVADLDVRAAVELAELERTIWSKAAGQPREAGQTRQKVKVDRQVIAIARVAGATSMLSDDASVRNLATLVGLEAKASWDLPLPPEDPQGALDLS